MIQIEGTTELIMYAAAMIVGAVMAVIIPYVLNAWVDSSTKFDVKHLVILIFAVFVAVFFALPTKVDIITIDVLRTAFLSGYGLTAIITKIVKSVIEKGTADEP